MNIHRILNEARVESFTPVLNEITERGGALRTISDRHLLIINMSFFCTNLPPNFYHTNKSKRWLFNDKA